MEISLVQALLIGLWTAFCWSGMLWGIYTNRCIVLSFGVGVILGDIPTALMCGAIGELAFMGFGVGAGGTVPPNPIGPGIMGTLMAISLPNVTPESALPISIPFAVAIQFLQTAIYTACAGAPQTAVKALKERNFKKFHIVSNMTLILFAIGGFFLGFLGAFSMGTLETIVNIIPEWLLKGLTVAGGMLPAIGFAMIMSVMLKKELIPFALIGYILAAYFKLPVIGIALVGAVFAIKFFIDAEKGATVSGNSNTQAEVEQDDWI